MLGSRLWGNQLRVDKCYCERMRVQIAHTNVALNKAKTSADGDSPTTLLTRTTQLKRGKPRTGTTDDAKVTQVELWRLEKCDLRIKAWEAREIQLEVRVGAKHECLSKWVARFKHERNGEVWRDCLRPQYYTKPGVSQLSETNRARSATRQLWQSAHSLHGRSTISDVLSAIVSFETVRRRVVQTSSQVMCDSCERSVSSFRGSLFSESGQSQFKRGQFIRSGCLMMTSIERWESHECNEPGQLRKGLQCAQETHCRESETSPKERGWKQQLRCKE